jgi:hypothetical protein
VGPALTGSSKLIGVDLVPERPGRARKNGVEALDLNSHDDLAGVVGVVGASVAAS